MSASVSDIMKLKLEKRLIEEKLLSTEGKVSKLNQILTKKSHNRVTDLPPESLTLTKQNMPVSNYILPKNPVRSIPKMIIQESTSSSSSSSSSFTPTLLSPKPIDNHILSTLKQKSILIQQEKQMNREKKQIEEKTRIETINKSMKNRLPVNKIPLSMLPNRYTRGELPCTIEHGANGQYLSWMAPFETLDYDYYLPLFFDGLQCKEHPYKFLARQGVEDLLYATKENPQRVLISLKKLILPLRNALMMYDVDVTIAVMKVIQQMIRGNYDTGEALLLHGRQFLVPLIPFLDKTKNLGDAIDYSQRKCDDVGEEVRKTLELLEEYGGPNALAYIKFSIPLYQSCLRPSDAHHRQNRNETLPPAVFSLIPKSKGKLWH